MKSIKKFFTWIKEKWWLPVATSVAIFITIVSARKKNSLNSFNVINNQFDEELEEICIKAIEEENQKTKETLARLGVKVEQITEEKKVQEIRLREEQRKRVQQLEQKSTKELANMLRKRT